MGGGGRLVIPRHCSGRWHGPGPADRIGLTPFGLMHLMSRGTSRHPAGPQGFTPEGGLPKPMLRAWPQVVSRPRMHNLLLLPRLPPTPNPESVVMFCLRGAPVLGSDVRLIHNNNVNRALLLCSKHCAKRFMCLLSKCHNSGKSAVITPILQVRKLRPENLKN